MRFVVAEGPVKSVTISGARQCGKTTRMLDMVAGCLLAGATPTIFFSNGSEAKFVRERLTGLLHELGFSAPRRIADSTVISDRSDRHRGRTGPSFYEFSDDVDEV